VGFSYIGGYIVRRFADLPLAAALFAQTHASVRAVATLSHGQVDDAAVALADIATFEVAWSLFRACHWEAAALLLLRFLHSYKCVPRNETPDLGDACVQFHTSMSAGHMHTAPGLCFT
jgi:hypothetical protein